MEEGGRKAEHLFEEQNFGLGVLSSRRRRVYLCLNEVDRTVMSVAGIALPQHLNEVCDL
jgi:hypothetical protein